MKTKKRYIWPSDYMADPSVHVFNGKIYIYPSHDWESGIPDDDLGSEYDMKDYHVLSIDGDDPMTSPVTDHGKVLSVEDTKWASRHFWDNDVACKDGKYYMYFPAKDKTDIFVWKGKKEEDKLKEQETREIKLPTRVLVEGE